ncbi:WecB/TagA/CpsF family glycosyltransferase [Agromyces allii]|uniref:Glycosyltransferase n=1 Tax=Agromyces allii TaxID=393607 RepID=A0ABP5C3M7_9MICO|nr:WecB/TagA/CpsF family glycosyltransferase [Agromyces allii]
MSGTATQVRLGGVPVDLLDRAGAIETIASRFGVEVGRPLAVASVNLDHVHHFGSTAPDHRALHDGPGAPVEWLNLIDGTPLATAARRITHVEWPRLAGSDLIDALLERAELDHARVGVLGGSADTHSQLERRLAVTHPALSLAGCWAPSRPELADEEACDALADDIAGHEIAVLLVCLGKPRQEVWIERYGRRTGCHVLLAFGAAVDFLAGTVERAPRWVADHGMEWAWRLALEPRRLAHRYLVDGPPAYLAIRRSSRPLDGAASGRRAAG